MIYKYDINHQQWVRVHYIKHLCHLLHTRTYMLDMHWKNLWVFKPLLNLFTWFDIEKNSQPQSCIFLNVFLFLQHFGPIQQPVTSNSLTVTKEKILILLGLLISPFKLLFSSAQINLPLVCVSFVNPRNQIIKLPKEMKMKVSPNSYQIWDTKKMFPVL